MIRKFVTVLLLAAAALVLVLFAVANREIVTVSFDPFDAAHPARQFSLPLFALMFILLIAGVIVGGCAAWLRQGKWRRRARRLEAEANALRAELAALNAADAIEPRPRAVEPP